MIEVSNDIECYIKTSYNDKKYIAIHSIGDDETVLLEKEEVKPLILGLFQAYKELTGEKLNLQEEEIG